MISVLIDPVPSPLRFSKRTPANRMTCGRVEQGGFTSGRLGNCSSKWFLDVKPEAVGPCFNVHFTTSVLHRGTGDNARATQFLVPDWYPEVRFHVMPTIKLTARTVETLKPPAAGRDEWWDSSLPGFGIRITDKGTRSWVLMYRMSGGGSKRRMTLGTFPMLSLAEARQAAGDALQKVERGIDPVAEKAAAKHRDS